MFYPFGTSTQINNRLPRYPATSVRWRPNPATSYNVYRLRPKERDLRVEAWFSLQYPRTRLQQKNPGGWIYVSTAAKVKFHSSQHLCYHVGQESCLEAYILQLLDYLITNCLKGRAIPHPVRWQRLPGTTRGHLSTMVLKCVANGATL